MTRVFKGKLILSAFFIPALYGGFALAQQSEVKADTEADNGSSYVLPIRQRLHFGLRGAICGELFQKTPVKILEEKEDWLRVSVEAWLPKEAVGDLGSVESPSTQIGGADTTSILSVNSFSIKVVSAGLKIPRSYLELSIKNSSSKEIRSWIAFLVAYGPNGERLFKETISDDKTLLKPGEATELSFFWTPQEQVPYNVLTGMNSDALSFKLEGLVIRQ